MSPGRGREVTSAGAVGAWGPMPFCVQGQVPEWTQPVWSSRAPWAALRGGEGRVEAGRPAEAGVAGGCQAGLGWPWEGAFFLFELLDHVRG